MPQVVQRDNTSLNRRDMETAFTCTCIWGHEPNRRAVVALTPIGDHKGIGDLPTVGPPSSSRAHAQGTLSGARVALDVLRDDGRTRV